MRVQAWTSKRLSTTSVLLLAIPLLSCRKPAVETPPSNPPEPIVSANAETSRVVPRRLNPIIITNEVRPPQSTASATNTAPVVTCGAAQTFPCSSADGTQSVLNARVEDADGQPLSVVWNIDGKDRYTQQVAAATPNTAADLTFSYDLTPGEHRIRVTVLDGALSASCETTVTVQKDTEDPVIECPGDIIARVDPGQCSAVVAYAPKATDNCPDVTLQCEPPSGSAFPIGTTPVECTATDTSANVSHCTFQVAVQFLNRCPRTEGFWRQNVGAWPANSLRLGNQVYSRTQLVPLLRATASADASMVLAKQLITACLNMANGSDPRPICAELAQAHDALSAFTGKLPFRVNLSSPAGRSMVTLSTALSGYNSGLMTSNCVP